jgi:hypothetical protein
VLFLKCECKGNTIPAICQVFFGFFFAKSGIS